MNLKPVVLLLGLCHSVSAVALGLGEITLRSHLGEPLHATVALFDPATDITAACFSLAASDDGVVPPPRAQLTIDHGEGQVTLHIRTLASLNDPIAQFTLVSDCEARVRRDYVVLLDPPSATRAAVGVTAVPVALAQTAVPAPRAAPPRRKPKPTPVASSKPERALPAAVAPRPIPAPVAASTAASVAPATVAVGTPSLQDAAPRLVLSGKRAPAAATPTSAHLDSDSPGAAQRGLTSAELSDENTALARKLAHLEAQLLALQQRYAALETKRLTGPSAITPPPPERPAQWPLYLLATGLLATGAGLLAWLPRRRARGTEQRAASAPPDTLRMTLSDISARSPTEARPVPQRMPEIAPPPTAEHTEVKEDILDQAEVFVAHGHGDLAVHLLQEHLRAAPTESPVPWLLLLDLLHREGDAPGYAAASAECRRYFNVNLSGHPMSQDGDSGKGLEAYPHLLEQLVRVWNTADTDGFFNDLIFDHRGGTRMGFEPAAYRDILLLRAIAQDVLAQSE